MKSIPVSCNKDCGAGCPLMAHVDEGGRVVKITDNPRRPVHMKGCVKGYQMHKSLYSEDRIKTPLIRTGKRGHGEFREASWEEALSEVANMLDDIRSRYGSQAILGIPGSGACRGVVHNTVFLIERFLNCFGGATNTTGNYSAEAARFVTPLTFGTMMVGSDPATLRDSNVIVLWGTNISVTRFGCDLENYLKEQRNRGVPIIVIDPRRSRTARKLDAEWIGIRPGTDSAFMAAVLWVLLEENLVDRPFIERYTHGFSCLESYILGEPDGVPKSPLWAEGICGTPARVIRDFALLYGRSKPAAILPGLSIQRTLGGEDAFRMCFALQAATGNTGLSGASSGGKVGSLPPPSIPLMLMKKGEKGQPEIPVYQWADAILEGTGGGFPTDIRAFYTAGHNLLNQGSDIRKNIKAFEKLEYAICHETFMTPTARYSDIILPATTFLEREDVMIASGNFLLYSAKVTDPLHGSRNDYDIFCDLAGRLGFREEFSKNRTAEAWLELMLEQSEVKDIPAFRESGIYLGDRQDRVGLADFVRKPTEHPLGTESGKIEISSGANQNKGLSSHPLCRIKTPPPDYPLSLVTPHSRVRINSTGANMPWAEKSGPQGLYLNPEDAENRGIRNGDRVLVTSPQGQTRVQANITEDIIPGVACLHQGRWVDLDSAGVDSGGAANMLTSTVPTLPNLIIFSLNLNY
jgi:anaerobic dimethyl sulfoxide reductase subunit A